jgi:ABC-type bacteriocin/lantibiotic exporter with double-glycine peptidase domain
VENLPRRIGEKSVATRISQSSVLAKIKLILNPEYPFYISSIIYGIGVSVLTLAIPISVQSLVNTVAFGVLTQPLVVLSIVLLLLLLFSGVLNALQVYVIELFQRRFLRELL